MKLNKILIIGKTPPPIGGVTIHTFRLIEYLKSKNIEFNFYNNNGFNIITFIRAIYKSKKAHIHLNNPFFLFLFVVICRFLNTYSILTIHGNVASYGKIATVFEKLAIRISNLPIVLNQKSYLIASKINLNTKLMSAFIPPLTIEILEAELQLKIDSIKQKIDFVYCTNAYSLVYDKNGNEIYGIMPLVKFFNSNPDFGLILSDPKGEYFNYFLSNNIFLNDNIAILNKNHSFFEVIKQTDCLIRNTSMDGDSLSINEALYCGKPVLASDCVSRPIGVTIYGESTTRSIENAIIQIQQIENYIPEKKPTNCAKELVEIYRNKI